NINSPAWAAEAAAVQAEDKRRRAICKANAKAEREAVRQRRVRLQARFPFAPFKCQCERTAMTDENGLAGVFDWSNGGWGCCVTCNRRNVELKTAFYKEKILGLTDEDLKGNGAELVHPDGTVEQRVWVRDGPYAPEWVIDGETKAGKPKVRDQAWE